MKYFQKCQKKFKIFPKYTNIFQNISNIKSSKIFQNISKIFPKYFQNISHIFTKYLKYISKKMIYI